MVNQLESLEGRLEIKDWIPVIGLINVARSSSKNGGKIVGNETHFKFNLWVTYQTASFLTASAGVMAGWVEYCQPYYNQMVDEFF